MNNRPENVPIATLSGLTSLSDVLGVLPLPDGAEAEERSTNGLISTQETLENARQILNGEIVDSLLLERLQGYLGKVNTSYLDFKNGSQQKPSDFSREQTPWLLQQLLMSSPQTFVPNYEQYASPSKFVNLDLTTPRHSLLRPHGPQFILSPTRSGPHIPVAHVSPLRQDPPEAATRTPTATSSKPSSSNSHQLSVSRTRRAQYHESRRSSLPQQILPQVQSQENTSTAGGSSAAYSVPSQNLVHYGQENRKDGLESQSTEMGSSISDGLYVRRKLYVNEKPDSQNEINSKTNQDIFNQRKKENSIQNECISPGSLKVSINRSGLKENPAKAQEKLTFEDEGARKEYPKRRRIDRLSYLQSCNDSSSPKQQTEDKAVSLENKTRMTNVEREKYLDKSKPKDVPVDILLLDGIAQEVRPVIPKLVLKRVKRKQGSKEFDTIEIVSPTKAELGIYYNDNEISGGSVSKAEQSVEGKHSESDLESSYRIRVVDSDVLDSTIATTETIREEEVLVGVNDAKAAPVSEENLKIMESYGFSDKSSHKKEEEEAEPSERRALRRKRRKISSESEEGVEEFTDALQVYRFSSKKDRTSKVLQFDEEMEVRFDTKRLIKLLQEILSSEEELQSDGILDFGEDGDIPEEALLPRPIISDFYIEISKLRTANLASELPHDQLVRIVLIMDRHVRDSMEVLLNQPKQDENEEEKLWKSLKMDRVLRACEASLIILHITTAPGMPKQVYMEEVIENLVSFCRFQLENTIYPEYDPVYRVDPNSKFDSSIMLPKTRRARSVNSTKLKPILQLYNKLCELISLIANLVSLENLTDIIILKISSIGTSPFFVENISFLQLEALKLVRTIFRAYVKHRDLILDDILASLARLPSSKRNLRNYRLSNDSSIQMVTALVLQLVQCTVSIPDSFDKQEDSLVDKDVMIVTSYEDSLRAAQNFLSTFLKKCSSVSKDENDFRPLFENFLQDILTTLNKPEWPAAEVLLTLLGKLLILTFNNKSNEMSLRVAAMDYLALIASHLRRDAVESRGIDKDDLKDIIEQLHKDDDIEDRDDISVDMIDIHLNTLRKALLFYLKLSSENDPSCRFSREFFLGQWIRDVHLEMEKCMKAPMMSIPGAASSEIPTDGGETSIETIHELEEKKKYYHSMATDRTISSFRSSQKKITYDEACIIGKYLSSSRSFSQSFDIYLQQIFKMLNEPAVALRTKAVKALTSIVSVDPNILEREDVQISVHCRLRDQSTLVREAAVDLIGHFVLQCPHITGKYYDMIIERILDTGISVRKRVIKILRDICIEQPDFAKVPEICIKMIRRINDEEGIRDLVTKVFQKMWFTPVVGNVENSEELTKKSKNIMSVVAMCKDCGYEWLENLLDNLLEGDDESVKKSTENACQQLVSAFIQKLVKTEQENGSELVACLTTLYFMCKTRPLLLVQHATTLQPYLSIKCSTQGDALVIQNVAKILENVIPLLDHPNPKFLAELEEGLMKLIIKQGQNIVQSCISCLDAVVNQVTRNHKFVVDCFKNFLAFLENAKKDLNNGGIQSSNFGARRPALLRSLFVAGLLCKHFDFDKHMDNDKKNPISLQVLEITLMFAKHSDEEIRLKAIMAVGFVCTNKPEYLLRNDCKSLYQSILSDDYKSSRGKCMLLKSLQNHLMDEESKMTQLEGRKKKVRKQKSKDDSGNIKEFGDSQSGTTSAVMQVMLKSILDTFFHSEAMVRFAAVQVVALILRQGLIHPAQCVPYLIAAGTDDDNMIKAKAEQSLTDIHKRHSGFIHMKAVEGIKLSYRLQKLIQLTDSGYLQGYRESESRVSFASHVYTMLRPNKQYRRPLLQTILKQFDDQKNQIDLLYFFAENLAYLPYVTQEEPLFVMHHCDMMVSVTGAGYLQNFKEIFFPVRKGKGKSPSHALEDDDDIDDVQKLGDAVTDLKKLEECVRESFCCMLLLELKHHLKQLYGFADSKCQKYSPSEPSKLYDKALTRRGEIHFNSHFKDLMFNKSALERQEMINYFIEFKQLMLSLDSEDDSEEADIKEKKATTEYVSNVECEDQEAKEQGEPNDGKSNSSNQGEAEELPVITGHPDEEKKQIRLEGSDINKSTLEEDVSQHMTMALKEAGDDNISEASSDSRSRRKCSKSKK